MNSISSKCRGATSICVWPIPTLRISRHVNASSFLVRTWTNSLTTKRCKAWKAKIRHDPWHDKGCGRYTAMRRLILRVLFIIERGFTRNASRQTEQKSGERKKELHSAVFSKRVSLYRNAMLLFFFFLGA